MRTNRLNCWPTEWWGLDAEAVRQKMKGNKKNKTGRVLRVMITDVPAKEIANKPGEIVRLLCKLWQKSRLGEWKRIRKHHFHCPNNRAPVTSYLKASQETRVIGLLIYVTLHSLSRRR